MKVEIYSDVVCPFCWIGKKQFEAALEQFENKDDVEVIYRSFELDKNALVENEHDIYDMLANKYGISRDQAIESNERVAQSGAQVGIDFQIAKSHVTNSFDAHRLIHFAARRDLQHEAFEALHEAYFSDGIHIGQRGELVKIGESLGFDETEVLAMLESDEYSDQVREDEARAEQVGVTGVPFFVIDEKYGISGAQGTENFLATLDQIAQEKKEQTD